MSNRVINGAEVVVYINNSIYGQATSIAINEETNDEAIYGIDSFYPQEIAPTRGATSGSISGFLVRDFKGLASLGITSLKTKPISGAYISLRIVDRLTRNDIAFIPKAKVTVTQTQFGAKGTVKLNFNFKAIMSLDPIDRV
jgi:hypothetical protein